MVNGRQHVIGSDRIAVEAVRSSPRRHHPCIGLNVTATGSAVRIEVPDAMPGGPTWGTVWIVMYKDAEQWTSPAARTPG